MIRNFSLAEARQEAREKLRHCVFRPAPLATTLIYDVQPRIMDVERSRAHGMTSRARRSAGAAAPTRARYK